MIAFWNNYLDSGSSISVYSENASYPATNVLDTRVSRRYRSDAVNSTELIVFKETINATFGALVGHNISSSAVIYFEGSSDAYSTWTSTGSFSTTIPWSSGIICGTFTSSSYPYWRVRVVGNSTTSSYTEIGCVMIGTWLQMPAMKPDQSIFYHSESKLTIGESGQAYGDSNYVYREFKVNFPYISTSLKSNMITMFSSLHNYTPFVLRMWDSDLSAENTMYCVINQNSMEFKRSDDIIKPWSASFVIREVF